jgi:hypothetical protein
MSQKTYIPIKEAEQLTGKSARTIRYHLQKFKETTNNKKILDSVFRYDKDDYDNDLLLINIDFLNKLYPNSIAMSGNRLQDGNAKVLQQDQTRPSASEIEDLVQMRMKVMQDAHQKEIERLEKAHQDYLERLDAGAIRMIEQHDKVVDLLSKTNDSLQKQLVAKDETARYLIEQIRELKQEKQIEESSYIDMTNVKNEVEAEMDNVASQHDPSEADAVQEAEQVDEVREQSIEQPIKDNSPKDIDEALKKGMSFAEWMSRQND